MDASKSSAHLFTSQPIQQSNYRGELAWEPPPPHQGTFPPASIRSPQNSAAYRFPGPHSYAPFDHSMYRVDPRALLAKGIIPEPLLMRQMLEVRHRMIRMRFRDPHAVFLVEENQCEAFMRSTCSSSSGKGLEEKYHRDVQRLLNDGTDFSSRRALIQHPAHHKDKNHLTPKKTRSQTKVDKRIAKQQVKEMKESAKMQKVIVNQQVKAMNDSAKTQKELGKQIAKEMKESAKVQKVIANKQVKAMNDSAKTQKELGKQIAKETKDSAKVVKKTKKREADELKQAAKLIKEDGKQQATAIEDSAKVIKKEQKRQAKEMTKAAKLESEIRKQQLKDVKEAAKVQKETEKQLVKEMKVSVNIHDETTKQQVREKKETANLQAEIAKQPSKSDLITHYSEAEAQKQPAPSTNNCMVVNRGSVEVANSVNSQRHTTTTADSLYSSQPTSTSTFKDHLNETFSSSSLAIIHPPKLNGSVSQRINQKSFTDLLIERVSETDRRTEMQECCKTSLLGLIDTPALNFSNKTALPLALKNETSKIEHCKCQTNLFGEAETRSTGDFTCGQQVKECGSKGESNETCLKGESSPSNVLLQFFKSPVLDSRTVNKPKKYESLSNKYSSVEKTSVKQDLEKFLFRIKEEDKKQKQPAVHNNKAKITDSKSFEKQNDTYDKVFENDLLKSIGTFVLHLKDQSECKTSSGSIDKKRNVKEELVKNVKTSKKFTSSVFPNEKGVPKQTEEQNRKNLKSILKNSGPENCLRDFKDCQHLEAAALSDQNQRSSFQIPCSKNTLNKITSPTSQVKSETSVALVSILKKGKRDVKVQSVLKPTNSRAQRNNRHI